MNEEKMREMFEEWVVSPQGHHMKKQMLLKEEGSPEYVRSWTNAAFQGWSAAFKKLCICGQHRKET